MNIDEPGPSDLGLFDRINPGQGFSNRLRKLPRRFLELLTKRHRPVDLKVTKLRILGRADQCRPRPIQIEGLLNRFGPEGLEIALEEHGRRLTGYYA